VCRQTEKKRKKHISDGSSNISDYKLERTFSPTEYFQRLVLYQYMMHYFKTTIGRNLIMVISVENQIPPQP